MNTYQSPSESVIVTTLATMIMLLIIVASIWIVSPFLAIVLWAAVIAIAAYPAFLRLRAALGGKAKLAATIIGIALAAILFIPLAVFVLTVSAHISEFVARLPQIDISQYQTPPAWIERIPLIGGRIAAAWASTFQDMSGTVETLRPQMRQAIEWLAPQIASSTLILLEAALAIILAAIFLLVGPRVRAVSQKLLTRFGAQDSTKMLLTIEKTTRSVVKGILGTAMIQAILAWIGFIIVGAPASVFLAFICFILCAVKLGMMLIGLPIAVWLWLSDDWTGAVFIIVWSLVVSVIDNLLNPILLGRDLPAPIWVLFLGIVGGLLTMGLIGLFLGPIILSLTYQFILRLAET